MANNRNIPKWLENVIDLIIDVFAGWLLGGMITAGIFLFAIITDLILGGLNIIPKKSEYAQKLLTDLVLYIIWGVTAVIIFLKSRKERAENET